MTISVIICTYNPDLSNFNIVLQSLREQTLPTSEWKLIVIDNNSEFRVNDHIDLSWHPAHLIVREEKKGLLNARITGFHLATEPLIVFVDDDNKLKKDYLKKALAFYKAHPQVGSFGGKSLPLFEKTPPKWFQDTGVSLGCQNHGDNEIISNFSLTGFKINEYPYFAPIGTGMIVTQKAFEVYLEDIKNDKERLRLGRSGNSLYSGEDNDLVLTIIKNGFEIAYVPQLVVEHLIPGKRLTPAYLSNMAYSSSTSWIKLLNAHKICPWQPIPNWSVPLRKIKAWFNYKVWRSSANYIKWRSACGMFDALSEIND